MSRSMLAKRILSLLLAALILVFIGYQVYHAKFSHEVTETALYQTAEQSVTATGYAVRQEKLLTNTSGGVLQYSIPDGGKVDKGGTVARAYASVADAGVLQKRQKLTQELTALQNLASQGSYVDANAENIDSMIGDRLLNVIHDARDDSTSLSDARQKLLALLNQKQLADGRSHDFSARISALQSQLSSLNAGSNGQQLGTVTAPDSGYFTSHVDGYEGIFNYQNVKELFPANLSASVKPAVLPGNAVGRVCSQFNWYFACVVKAADIHKLQPETSVQIMFPYASAVSVPATVVRINQKSRNADAAVILQCSVMDSALVNIRRETAKIIIDTCHGIQVSQKAVHFAKINGKSVEGVYVMHGIEMQFKQIVPLYSDGNSVYCDPTPDTSKMLTSGTIQLYDEVVTEGKDLRDGKIIE